MPDLADAPARLTTAEAAALLGCSEGYLRALARAGTIRGERVDERRGSYYLFDPADVAAYRPTHACGRKRRGAARQA